MYKHFLRHILFSFSPEVASGYLMASLALLRKMPGGLSVLKLFYSGPVNSCVKKDKSLRRELFGLSFPHPIGVAGGLDKNGEFYNDLGALGFSFVEIGSITVDKYDGNRKPRVFRLTKDKALINRLGINNKGVKYAIRHIQKDRPNVIISANIACNPKCSTVEEVASSYKKSFELMYDFVDMFTINLSYPMVKDESTKLNLCGLEYIERILDSLLDLRLCYEESKPILVKISPDLSTNEIEQLLDWCMGAGIDGVVACNTTSSREGLSIDKKEIEKIGEGGLSGAPLFEKSLSTIKFIHDYTKGRLPIIGVGGVMTAQQAKQMLDSGASLVEVHTGFIYEGLSFAKQLVKGLSKGNLK